MARFRRRPALEASHQLQSETTLQPGRYSSLESSGLRDELLTAHEVARRLGVRTRWVTDKCHQGLLPGYRLPGSNRLRFSWDDVLASLERLAGD